MLSFPITILPLIMSNDSIARHKNSDKLEDLSGLGRSMPFPTLGFVVSGLSLVGFPLVGAFAGRLAVYEAVSLHSAYGSFALIVASIILLVSYGNVYHTFFAESRVNKERADENVELHDLVSVRMLILFLCIVIVVIGIYPALVLGPIREVLDSLIFLKGP